MKHSSGPFQRGSLRSCDIELLDARGLHIATVHHPVGEHGGADPADIQDANAALLLAAPDLLAACNAAAALLVGVADEDQRLGKRNSAMNVREVERQLASAIAIATGGVA